MTGPHRQEVAAGGWTIAAGRQPAWFPASVPFQAAGVRAFEITAGHRVLVTVGAAR